MSKPDLAAAYLNRWSQLALHLVSEHGFTPAALTDGLGKNDQDHEYEHGGAPGTIRNHPPGYLHWVTDKITAAIRDHDLDFSDLPDAVSDMAREYGITEQDPPVMPFDSDAVTLPPPGMYTGTNGVTLLVGADRRNFLIEADPMMLAGFRPVVVAGVRIENRATLAALAAHLTALADTTTRTTRPIP